jgi:hypothetical protein
MDISAKRPIRIALAFAIASLIPVTLGAQSPAKGKWRTPWGDPDLQGSWSNATTTPLQRGAKYGNRKFLTPEEKAELDKQTAIGTDKRSSDPVKDVGDAYNRFWWDRGWSDGRTALIFDPSDGRIPALTPEGQKRHAAFDRTEGLTEDGAGGRADSWLDRSLYERCVIRAPLPRVPTGYDNNYQIVQTPGYVAIFQEQMHETRLIPLDGRPHLDPSLRQWLGDSRGHWEGDTLVVETTNFSDRTDFQGSGPNMRLVERWTRLADDHIDYRFTVEDSTAWTKPWSAAIGWNKVGLLYEYACHEGNYGLYGILEGARVQEAEGAAKKAK